MRIALLVPSWPPGSMANGIVTYASYVVPALRRLGHDVYILTPNNAMDDKGPWTIDLQRYSLQPTIWDRVMFRLCPETAIFNRTSAPIAAAIRELVESKKIDVLELEETFGWSFAITRMNLLPVVVRLHGPWFVNKRFGESNYGSIQTWVRVRREGRGIGDAQIVTSPSADMLRAVKDHYALNLTGSKVIANPIKAALEKDTWDIATCRKDTLLFVGRIDYGKGADLVLRAFAKLAERHPRLRLTMVGPDRGLKEPGGKIHSFEEFARVNIPETFRSRIEFLGSVSHSDVMSLRSKCFATLIASRHETFPYAVLEAMSQGCPLIATAVGGIPELITDYQNGLLIPSEDLGAMIDACEKLLCDTGLAARLGHQAWRDCRDFYDAEKIAKQTVAAYQEAIDVFKFGSTRESSHGSLRRTSQ